MAKSTSRSEESLNPHSFPSKLPVGSSSFCCRSAVDQANFVEPVNKVKRKMDVSPTLGLKSHSSHQRSIHNPSGSSGDCSHPIILSPTTTYNYINYDDLLSRHSEAQSNQALLSTAADCFQAQDYNRVILLLEDASSALPTSDTEAAIILGCALAYYKICDHKTSAAKFRRLEDSTSPDARFLACVYLGEIQSATGDHLGASSYYSKATSRYIPTSSIATQYHLQMPSLSSLYIKQAAHLKRASRIMAAIEAYSRAIATATDCKEQHAAYTGLGTLHHGLGDHSSAVQQYTRALALAEEAKDFVSLAYAHGNIGNAYVGLHQKDKAIFHLQKSLDLVLEHDPVPLAIGRAYNNLGTAYQSLGDLDRADEYYKLALGQGIYGKDLAGQARAHGNMGNIAMLKKDYTAAVENFTDTLLITDTFHVGSDPAIRITAHHNRGCCLCEKAREMVADTRMDNEGAQITYHGPSSDKSVLEGPVQKLYEEALKDLRLVIGSYETTLQSIKGSGEGLGLSVSLAENNSRTFHYVQDCLCALGRHFEALIFAEQSRSRSLGELLLKKKTSTQEVRWTYPPLLSFEDMKDIVLAQSKDVVYLSYTGAYLLVWVLSPLQGIVVSNMFEVKLSTTLFNGSVWETFLHTTLSEHIADHSLEMFEHCDYSVPSPLHPLHSVLVQPLLTVLVAVHSGHLPEEILLVPDSNTLIPFAALLGLDRSGFIGDRLRFRIMPSLLVMGLMQQASPHLALVSIPTDSRDFCIVGDPTIPPFRYNGEDWRLGRLPHAGREARWVAHILKSGALLGDKATKSNVSGLLEKAKLIHIATHGGRGSGFLALAGSSGGSGDSPIDGSEVLLLPSEVEQMNLRAALVVLSSCDSGRGTVRADGIIGMGRAFLLAGAQSVLTTLWRIPDESAGMFMQFFYQYLVDGLGTTHALQKATLSVRCFRKYSQYTHWGGFQLIGRDVQFVVERSLQDEQVCQLLGRGSHAFPRLDLLSKMEGALLACGNKPSDVQILHSCPGLSPEEPVIDFITKHHAHFKGGIFWVNGSSKWQLRAAEKVLLTSIPPSLWKQENATGAPPSNLLPVTPSTEPLLIILDNVCTEVTSEPMLSILRSCHTYIVVITSRPTEAVQEEVSVRLCRGSSVLVVEPLSPLHATQRLVYTLQSRTHLVPFNREQDMLAQLVHLSHGSPDLLDAFASVLLEHSSCAFEACAGLMEEMVLPKDNVICLESGDWFTDVSSLLVKGFHSSPAQSDHPHLTSEDQVVLSSLSLFGDTPIPHMVVEAIEGMVEMASSCSTPRHVVERLKERHLVKQYPSLCVAKPCASIIPSPSYPSPRCPSNEEQPIVLLGVPTLVADAIWSVQDDAGQVMALAVAHKALREACRHVSSEDTYLSSLCAGLVVALAESAVGVARLTSECYAELCQPVVWGDVK